MQYTCYMCYKLMQIDKEHMANLLTISCHSLVPFQTDTQLGHRFNYIHVTDITYRVV